MRINPKHSDFIMLYFCLHYLIRLLCAFLFLFGGLLFGAPVLADNRITALRLGQIDFGGQSALRVVVETAERQPAQLSLLSRPWRLVIDYASMGWGNPDLPLSGPLDDPLAVAYRFGHPRAGIGRLVIELSRPASPEQAFILSPSPNRSGHRLVIDLLDRGATQFKLAQNALASGQFHAQAQASNDIVSPIAPPKVRPPKIKPKQKDDSILSLIGKIVDMAVPTSRPKSFLVAIDAGHGGKDPGAIGKRGTKEKHITLATAKQLAAHLNRYPRIKARLIRSEDRYYKLRQRIDRARQMRADIFISLHADSAPSASARGISVFSLSDKASDKEAAHLARQENKADLIGGPDLDGQDPLAANALLGMFQRESMNESAKLARFILNEIRDFPGGDKRGHRFAGFAVLKAPDIPSVLIELGFLSHARDEKNLNSKRYRDNLTKQLAKAVHAYFLNCCFE